MGRRLWFLSRPTKIVGPGDSLLFYQNGRGVRGHATLISAEPVGAEDATVLRELGLSQFALRLLLKSVVEFKNPVSLRSIVRRLSFVRNKEYWGQALRTTPRVISKADFDLILQAAKSWQQAKS